LPFAQAWGASAVDPFRHDPSGSAPDATAIAYRTTHQPPA